MTQSFFSLTPDHVLRAVEVSGLICTGRCIALNSFENRVYDVELETGANLPKNSPLNRRIVKFYRPGRWSYEQILEEHEFLKDLSDSEIPVIAPLTFPDGGTCQSIPESGIIYTLFPKVGGRSPDELSREQLIRIGRLLGRIHSVGLLKKSKYRMKLTPETYGYSNLEFLVSGKWIPMDLESKYRSVVEKICTITASWFDSIEYQRIHGDCHLGNLLWNDLGPFFLDFDDMLEGPPVQDLWLLIPGRDQESMQKRDFLLEGYREFKKFDQSSLKLVEVLRALRYVHYAAWLAKRWEDPAFPLAFPQFGSHAYWQAQVNDLEEQWEVITGI
jgi:Ser/Thr protein kinase RdoA (MazF antagonist)